MTPEQIGAPGLRMFVLLHGEKDTDNLSSLRYAKYMKMASTTLSLKPEKLPPTNRAAYFYFLLVYYQVKNGTLYEKTVQMQRIGLETSGWNIDTSLGR